MMANLGLTAAALYASLSLFLIFRAHRFQWFWGSVVLWLAVSFLGARLLPGIWGITHVGPLFVPHFYLTVASAFFFVDFWRKTSDRQYWQADMQHPWLSLFAVSNVLMTLVFAVIVLTVWWQSPTTTTAFLMPAMLSFYALNPIYWFILQLVLMAVFYVDRTIISRRPAAYFSGRQLFWGGWLAFLMQSFMIFRIALEVRF